MAPGAPLQDLLFAQGVEFPCGGRGRCKGCRVKVIEGQLPATEDDERLLTADELAAGFRLACCARPQGDLKLELAQWEATILADDSVFAFTPREGWGVAGDLGTTTVVAQLLDLRSGEVHGVRMALNAQTQHGADIMSRVDYAVAGGQGRLEQLIRAQVGGMVAELLRAVACDTASVRTRVRNGVLAVYLAGNLGVYKCPADSYLSPAQRARGFMGRTRSLTMNAFFGPYSANPSAGETWVQGRNAHFSNYRQWLKLSTVPRPANYFVVIDEHPDSINDGYFLNNPSSIQSSWGDGPAAYHGGAGGLSYADGHSEIKKWKQPVARVQYGWNPPVFDAGGRLDYAWLIERTAVLYAQ